MSRRDPAVAGQTGEVRERAVRLEVVVLGCEVEIGLARAYSREPIVDAGKQRDAIAATAHRGEALAEAAGLVHGAGDGIGPGGRKAQLFETGCEARRRDALRCRGGGGGLGHRRGCRGCCRRGGARRFQEFTPVHEAPPCALSRPIKPDRQQLYNAAMGSP